MMQTDYAENGRRWARCSGRDALYSAYAAAEE